jgi:hypothetical protein
MKTDKIQVFVEWWFVKILFSLSKFSHHPQLELPIIYRRITPNTNKKNEEFTILNKNLDPMSTEKKNTEMITFQRLIK